MFNNGSQSVSISIDKKLLENFFWEKYQTRRVLRVSERMLNVFLELLIAITNLYLTYRSHSSGIVDLFNVLRRHWINTELATFNESRVIFPSLTLHDRFLLISWAWHRSNLLKISAPSSSTFKQSWFSNWNEAEWNHFLLVRIHPHPTRIITQKIH